ncbi:hypothetical protein RYX36_029449, partial [Vicia faba]
MKPTYNQGSYETRACKNATPKDDYSNDERMSTLSEYDFILDKQEENPCLPGDIESGGEKTIKRMDLRLEEKVWYQFIKHFLRPTTYKETINK